MSGGALALALGAALLHAAWNVLLAGSRDTVAATGGLLLWGVVLLAPAAALTGDVSASAAPYIAASAALEVAYFALLARAYRGGEVGVVYPVARGSAPVLVLAVGALALG
ncbi:MAG: EamA family transporter, partial [Thermoleophilaceae bacterium]